MAVANKNILIIPASTSYLTKVRDFVAGHARKSGFSSSAIEEIRLAVDEACTNVIQHAYQNDSSQKIRIHIGFNKDKMVISLTDTGSGFNPDTYVAPDVKGSIKKKQRGGLGVYLMREFMDKVEYRKTGTSNELRMTKSVS